MGIPVEVSVVRGGANDEILGKIMETEGDEGMMTVIDSVVSGEHTTYTFTL